MTFYQQIIYKCILLYFKTYNKSPSVRDICALANLSSPATVHTHLKNLKKLGYIKIHKNKTRGIEVLK